MKSTSGVQRANCSGSRRCDAAPLTRSISSGLEELQLLSQRVRSLAESI